MCVLWYRAKGRATAWSWPPGSVHRWWGTCTGGGGAGCPGQWGGRRAGGHEEGWADRRWAGRRGGLPGRAGRGWGPGTSAGEPGRRVWACRWGLARIPAYRPLRKGMRREDRSETSQHVNTESRQGVYIVLDSECVQLQYVVTCTGFFFLKNCTDTSVCGWKPGTVYTVCWFAIKPHLTYCYSHGESIADITIIVKGWSETRIIC